MNKKAIVWLVIALVVMVAASFWLFGEPGINEADPETWIIRTSQTQAGVDLQGATAGKSFLNEQGLQYLSATTATTFALEGWYQGKHFRQVYADQDGRVQMRITPKMQPYDGIPEGFILQKLDPPEAYIFLDLDWKEKYPQSVIYWGRFFENEQAVDFSSEVKGIYIDRIEDDISRFQENFNIHDGGVMVGILNEDETSTLIRLS
jgi:hypothetical protein